MKRNILTLIAIVLSLAVTHSTHSFESEGFQSGMTLEAVKKKCNEWNFDKVEVSENSIRAFDLPLDRTGRLYDFIFCKNRLVHIQKDYTASMKKFIMLVDQLTQLYGQSIRTNANTSLIGAGQERNNISFIWRMKNNKQSYDRIELFYTVFETNDQMSVVYQTPHSCWQIWK